MAHLDYTGLSLSDLGGARRVHGDILRLAFTDATALPGLTIPDTSELFHYRFGNDQPSLPSGFQATANGVVGVGEDAWIEPPGEAADYRYLFEPNNATPVPLPPASTSVTDSFVVGAWTDLGSGVTLPSGQMPFQVLMGHSFRPNPSGMQSDGQDDRWTTMYVAAGSLGSDDQVTLSLYLDTHTQSNNHSSLYAQCQIPLTRVQERHLLVHTFFTKTNQGKTWYARFYVDGQYVSETAVPLDTDFKWYAQADGAMQVTAEGTLRPGLLAMKHSDPPWAPASVWGVPDASYGWQGNVDELFAAHCHPILAGGSPVVAHEWQAYQPIFRAMRHPDPAAVGVSSPSLLVHTPVVDTAAPSGHGVAQVRIDYSLPEPSTGQRVSFSVRASDTSFVATTSESTVPWSEWVTPSPSGLVDLRELELVGQIAGGIGRGRHVQMRIRMFPSSDGRAMASPAITRVQLWTGFVDWQNLTSDLGAAITVPPYHDLDGSIRVINFIDVGLDAQLHVLRPLTPLGLPCDINISPHWNMDASVRVTGLTHAEHDLPASMFVVQPDPSGIFVDLPGSINVVNHYNDLGGQLHVNATYSLSAEINVIGVMLDGSIRVIRNLDPANMAAEIRVVEERPGSVAPITANVPAATWTTTQMVTFGWQAASFEAVPVIGYHWRVDAWPTSQASTEWDFTEQLYRTANMADYGPGVRYIHVAAVNTDGVLGPTAHYEVWYNRPPTTPGLSFMWINGVDTLLQTPLVPRMAFAPTFQWSPASDADDGDTLFYEIQIATRQDFGTNPDGSSSIVHFQDQIASTSWQMNPILPPGKFFWRIRATDVKQFSDWGSIGSFRLNHPPSGPRDLVVFDV